MLPGDRHVRVARKARDEPRHVRGDESSALSSQLSNGSILLPVIVHGHTQAGTAPLGGESLLFTDARAAPTLPRARSGRKDRYQCIFLYVVSGCSLGEKESSMCLYRKGAFNDGRGYEGVDSTRSTPGDAPCPTWVLKKRLSTTRLKISHVANAKQLLI